MRNNNHEITIYLKGGSVLGPFHVFWDDESESDARDLIKDFDHFLQGEKQVRHKYHLHDSVKRVAHTIFVSFGQIEAIYDQVSLNN